LLRRWETSEGVVRVIATAEDELIAVFSGCLQACTEEKRPALFWPLELPSAMRAERPGIYLHPDSYQGARIHTGEFVVEYRQAGVTVNVRRIGKDPG
jgi:hypothetical protein